MNNDASNDAPWGRRKNVMFGMSTKQILVNVALTLAVMVLVNKVPALKSAIGA